jgi:hypothetical protein
MILGFNSYLQSFVNHGILLIGEDMLGSLFEFKFLYKLFGYHKSCLLVHL